MLIGLDPPNCAKVVSEQQLWRSNPLRFMVYNGLISTRRPDPFPGNDDLTESYNNDRKQKNQCWLDKIELNFTPSHGGTAPGTGFGVKRVSGYWRNTESHCSWSHFASSQCHHLASHVNDLQWINRPQNVRHILTHRVLLKFKVSLSLQETWATVFFMLFGH